MLKSIIIAWDTPEGIFVVRYKTISNASAVSARMWAGQLLTLYTWEKLIKEISMLLHKLNARVPNS